MVERCDGMDDSSILRSDVTENLSNHSVVTDGINSIFNDGSLWPGMCRSLLKHFRTVLTVLTPCLNTALRITGKTGKSRYYRSLTKILGRRLRISDYEMSQCPLIISVIENYLCNT